MAGVPFTKQGRGGVTFIYHDVSFVRSYGATIARNFNSDCEVENFI